MTTPDPVLMPEAQAPCPGRSVSEALSAAADLISPRGRWSQGSPGRDRNSARVPSTSAKAVAWCALGALDRCADGDGALYWRARCSLADMIGDGVARWNDRKGRRQVEVVAALREAARITPDRSALASSNKEGGDRG